MTISESQHHHHRRNHLQYHHRQYLHHLGERIVAEINRLGILEALLAAPGLAPEPLLGQGLDGDLVDHVVGQVLVQVGQTVGVLAQRLVLSPESVSCEEEKE